MSQCKTCSETDPTKFKPRRPNQCHACINTYHRAWRAANPEKQAAAGRRHRAKNREQLNTNMRRFNKVTNFGADANEWYAARFTAQDGVCAICGKPECRERNGRRLDLAIDHDHACCPGRKSCGPCRRSLLCGSCNAAIGQLRDDPTLMRAAALYVESYRAD